MQNFIAKVLFRVVVVAGVGLSGLSTLKPADSGAGFFIGGELGYSAIFSKTTLDNKSASTFPLGNLGAKFGYIAPLNDKFGLRVYLGYNWAYSTSNTSTPADPAQGTAATNEGTLLSYHQIAGNVDVLWKFTDMFGAYIGAGVGYGSYSSVSTTDNVTTTTNVASGMVIPVNVGVETYIGGNHTLGLNFKIPTIAYKGTDTAATTTEVRNLIITLGYSYKF
ncbi:outer membrane beta-barrel protein [Helicobacter sp. 23-1046]